MTTQMPEENGQQRQNPLIQQSQVRVRRGLWREGKQPGVSTGARGLEGTSRYAHKFPSATASMGLAPGT